MGFLKSLTFGRLFLGGGTWPWGGWLTCHWWNPRIVDFVVNIPSLLQGGLHPRGLAPRCVTWVGPTKIPGLHCSQTNQKRLRRWKKGGNKNIPRGSMWIVYFPAFSWFFMVNTGEYTSPIGSYWRGWKHVGEYHWSKHWRRTEANHGWKILAFDSPQATSNSTTHRIRVWYIDLPYIYLVETSTQHSKVSQVPKKREILQRCHHPDHQNGSQIYHKNGSQM